MGGWRDGLDFWKIQNLENGLGVVKNAYVEVMKRTWF